MQNVWYTFDAFDTLKRVCRERKKKKENSCITKYSIVIRISFKNTNIYFTSRKSNPTFYDIYDE